MGELQTMIELTKDTNNRVHAISNQLGAIEERCQSHQKQLNGHQFTLYGVDGSGGMVADVGDLKKCKKTTSMERQWWSDVLKEIVKWAAILFIGFLLFLWKTHPMPEGRLDSGTGATQNMERINK